MANYLPVLLVSLSTNSIPDDTALTTAPRAQVDYLSHDWQEEDVWRSWRNMTRQKNAIANGVRLENASWRTWWKQRNKLGTVSPETLNWLKDSDVTWLYGPLHTAAEWKPPPRQLSAMSSNPDTAAPARPNSPSSAHPSRRSTLPAPYKPILKHRSISELLTSELPATSPIFSPIDSDEDPDTDVNTAGASPPDVKSKRPPLFHTRSDTHITRWRSHHSFRGDSPPRIVLPGIENGNQSFSSSSPLLSAAGPVRASLSQDSNSSGKSGASGSEHSQSRHSKKKHISFNTFVEQWIAIDKPKKNASGYFGVAPESVWMGGRTAWIDDGGYEEDQEDSGDEKVYVHESQWTSDPSEFHGTRAVRDDSDSAGEDEDDDDDDAIEIRSTSSRSSTLRPDKNLLPRSQSKFSTTSSSSSTSTSTSTTSSRSIATTDNTSSPSGSLSPSRRIPAYSNILSKPMSSTLNNCSPVYRRSSTTSAISTYRPSLHRTPRPPLLSRSSLECQHVTIAPIAPTLLKTTPTPSWTENLGDDGSGSCDDLFAGWAWGIGGKVGTGEYTRSGRDYQNRDLERDGGLQRRRSWTSGYGPDSYGFAPGAFGLARDLRPMHFGGALDSNDEHGSDGTPVELVYVPPYEYDFRDAGVVEDEDDEREEERAEIEQVEDIDEPGTLQENVYHHIPVSGSTIPSSTNSTPIPINRSSRSSKVPTVVVDGEGSPSSSFVLRDQQRRQNPTAEDEEEEHDPYDYFGGPDMGDDYFSRRGGRDYDYGNGTGRSSTLNLKSSSSPSYAADARQLARELERKNVGNGDARQSRSRSQSRTPSPALLNSTNAMPSPAIGSLNEATGFERPRSNSFSSLLTANGLLSTTSPSTRRSSQSDMLSPPMRGRQFDAPLSRPANGILPQQDERRGRSSTRTSSSSSWDRERGSSSSLSSTSPMGSLSPDGLDGPCRRASMGSGVSAVLGTVGSGNVEKEREKGMEFERGRERRGRERTSSRVLSSGAAQNPGAKNLDASFVSAASSSSSDASTVMPKQGAWHNQDASELMHMQQEMLTPKTIPTPVLGIKTSFDTIASSSFDANLFHDASHSVLDKEHVLGVDRAIRVTPPTRQNGVFPLSTSPSSSPPKTSPSRSSSKYRPPATLRPTPPSPAKPSTSFTAAVIPSVSTSTSPVSVSGGAHAETIVGKAVDIVSSAGLYLGLWGGRERSSAALSSPSSPS